MNIKEVAKKLYTEIRYSNLRGLFYHFKFKGSGERLHIGHKCRIKTPSQIHVGNDVIIDDYAELLVHDDNGNHATLTLGDHVHISKYNCIGCSFRITLEDHVRLAPYVHITDRNHTYEDVNQPIWKQPIKTQEVFIGRESWLGFGVQIMPGVNIGRHCIIAAGSIVTHNIPDYSVAAGSPAKVVKKYNLDKKVWERI